MSAETVALVTPFLVGAVVLCFALLQVSSLLALLDDRRHRQYWAAAGILIGVFLLGYLGSVGLLLAGERSLLVSTTGAFSLLGAVFTFLVVTTGERTIDELVRSRDELERREEEFERLYEVTDVLNRILRHNLRNNMNVILGRSNMLEEDGDPAEHVDAIQAEARRLVEIGEKARTIHDTLDAEVAAEVQLAGAFVAPVVADVRRSFPEASIEIVGDEECWIEAGPLFETAVENVLDNAVRHNDGDASVTVRITPSGEEAVAVSIADDGPGIRRYEIEAIREHRETPLQHGSGLGLWLTSWIVDQYDGAIAFEDNEPRGTVVTLTMPRADPAAGEDATAGAAAADDAGQGSGAESLSD